MTWAELNEVRNLRKDILVREKELAALRHLLDLKVPKRDGLPKATPIDSQIERMVTRVVDAEREIDELKKKLEQEVTVRLEDKIKREIKDSTARTLFILRYVYDMYFRDIGFAMGYSEAHIYYLHRITGEKIVSDWNKNGKF